ncbi:hypothetical protein C8R45DRAFT_1089021 [Mycena sanguinolenta]|nr:hypothetical protein C8R45DRAFT_1089021 [Mycena sanguinolenta]
MCIQPVPLQRHRPPFPIPALPQRACHLLLVVLCIHLVAITPLALALALVLELDISGNVGVGVPQPPKRAYNLPRTTFAVVVGPEDADRRRRVLGLHAVPVAPVLRVPYDG